MGLLADNDIVALLEATPGWERAGDSITTTVTHAGFLPAVEFVNRVAALAEAADHHPDIDIRWNTVTLTLSTHSDGGLTAKDFALAKQIDTL
ncbi:MAG: 4a-hydroxytetrahydrobiopterin dehydratase [Streptosporangiaceae bacterium]